MFARGDVSCEDTGLGAGITGNTAESGAGVFWRPASSATLSSTDCDWGTSGVDDNDTGDIGGTLEHDVEGVASFTCDADTGSCTE